MFAPKVAKPQTKAAENPKSALAPHRSTLVGHRLGHDPVEQALFLQRTIGNQATLRFLARRDSARPGGRNSGEEQEIVGENMSADTAPRGVSWDFTKIPLFPPEQASRAQPLSVRSAPPRGIEQKLAIGFVDDPLEHEADWVADQVMRMSDPAVSVQAAPPQISRKCAACAIEEEEKEKQLRMKPAGDVGAAGGEAPHAVHDVLGSAGQPLDAETRAFFEPRFGRDFGDVRVHADARAAQSAQAVNALAFTVGNHVVFANGEFGREASQRRLLAHELTHVLQQSGSGGIRVEPHPILRRQQDPAKTEMTKEQMRSMELSQLAMLPHHALKQWKTLTQSERDEVLTNMIAHYGAPFTSEFLKYAKGLKKAKPGLAGALKGPEYTQKWLFDRGYRHAYGEIWVRPSGEFLMVLPPAAKDTSPEPPPAPPKGEQQPKGSPAKPPVNPDTHEYGGVTYDNNTGKIVSYPKEMEARCMLACVNDTYKNEDECSDCCVEKISASDSGCLTFCIQSCHEYHD
jgi:hypothetical protein